MKNVKLYLTSKLTHAREYSKSIKLILAFCAVSMVLFYLSANSSKESPQVMELKQRLANTLNPELASKCHIVRPVSDELGKSTWLPFISIDTEN